MAKISTKKKKILSFIEKRGITKVDFCGNTGISYANLKGKGLLSEIGGVQIGKILSIYKEINPDWLLTGSGEMLREQNDTLPYMLKNTPVVDVSENENNKNTGDNSYIIDKFLAQIQNLSEEVGRLKSENTYLLKELSEKRGYEKFEN
jgi:hypothetical protein